MPRTARPWTITTDSDRVRPSLVERYQAWSAERREMREFRRANPGPLATPGSPADVVLGQHHRLRYAV
ncbi:MAG: hypothetical protein HRT86_09425 [Ilumatobacteraceae bacterium]|nr:hypothetical protein [Ilumatobacteraceae bacterium]